MSEPLDFLEIFKQIYYYIYNNNVSKVKNLGTEIVKVFLCKIYDEIHNDSRIFTSGLDRNNGKTGEKIRELFEKLKRVYPGIFDKDETIHLDYKSIEYIVEKIKNYSLIKAQRDIINESFQFFEASSLRSKKGQFFTPRNVARMCINIVEPKPSEKIIDPACGLGSFLVELLLCSDNKGIRYNIYGIDKEIELAKICRAYTAVAANGYTNIFCADSLYPASWDNEIRQKVQDESFDIVLANPPFGTKISIGNEDILKNYKLGHKWIKNSQDKWEITNTVLKQVPQILFIERCLQLLKPGGRMAIVLPDGVLGNPTYKYVWQFIIENAKIQAIISLPPETFSPGTKVKTSILFLKKTENREKDYEIFFAIVDKIGHDKNGKTIFKMDAKGNYILDEKGNKIIDDDLPLVSSKYKEFKNCTLKPSQYGFAVKLSEIKNYIFVPHYYNPETQQKLNKMKESGKYKIITIGEMVKQKLISIKRGIEVGSKYYGLGDVPFIRTSNIANWEIKISTAKCIPDEIYERYKKKQNIKENDILLVTDGTYLIGETAIITSLDRKILIQSHIRRIRCLKPDKLHPYLLFYLLNTNIVQRQIKEKTFIQSTISTIGERLYEIAIPIPVDSNEVKGIINKISEIIKMKTDVLRKMEEIIKSGQYYGQETCNS